MGLFKKKDASQSDDKKSAEKKEEKVKTVGVFKLFHFADKQDKILLAITLFLGMTLGAIWPLFSILFGDVIGDYNGGKVDFVNIIYEMLGLGGYSFLAGSVVNVCMEIITERQACRMRLAVLEGYMRKDVGCFDKNDAGALSQKMTGLINDYKEGIGNKFIQIFQGAVCLLTGLAVALWKGYVITFCLLGVFPIVIIGLGLIMKGMAGRTTQGWYAKAASKSTEILYGIRTIVAFGTEKRELAVYQERLEEARKSSLKTEWFYAFGVGLMTGGFYVFVAFGFTIGALLIYGGYENPNSGKPYSGGEIMTIIFSLFISMMFSSVIGPSLKALSAARTAAAEVFEIIEDPSEIEKNGNEGSALPDSFNNVNSIEFSGVHFNYPSRPDVPILTGLNLFIRGGQKVALVGESGSGKSTIVALLERFYDVQEGAVKINGVDIREVDTRQLRHMMGFVGQEPVLFTTSIRDNLNYGSPNATDEEIQTACKRAMAHDFIMKLPDKYDTFVGSAGSQLSGGQKQRIAIARTLR